MKENVINFRHFVSNLVDAHSPVSLHIHTVWHKILAGVYFCWLATFCVLQKLIFAITADWFSCYPVPSIDDSFVFRVHAIEIHNYFRAINQYFVVSEWKRQVVIEQAWFLSTVYLCSKFKLENIYSGVNVCGKNVCSNFYLRIYINYFYYHYFLDKVLSCCWRIFLLSPY